MRLKQRETLAVVESAIKGDGPDLAVKAVEYTEELGEDTAEGITRSSLAKRRTA